MSELLTGAPPGGFRLTCHSCEDWKVRASEKSLELTIATHRFLFHDGDHVAYTVEPMGEDEDV